jgi:hypothetical protein
MLPQLLNMTGGTNVRLILGQQIRERQREQARAEHHANAAEDQELAAREIEFLARQRREDERGSKYIHVDAVDP